MDQHILEETFQLQGLLLLAFQLHSLQPLLIYLLDILMNLLKFQQIETHTALPIPILPHKKTEGFRMLQFLLAPNMVQLLIPQQRFLDLTITLMKILEILVFLDLTLNMAQQFQVRMKVILFDIIIDFQCFGDLLSH
jgi:hypothetical protein